MFTFQEQYDAFMASADRPTTSGGKPASPPIEMQMEWIANAWQALTPELIARSFVTCGINATDGSEDDAIHFFKLDGPCPAGRAQLDAAHHTNNNATTEEPSTAPTLCDDDEDTSRDTSLDC